MQSQVEGHLLHLNLPKDSLAVTGSADSYLGRDLLPKKTKPCLNSHSDQVLSTVCFCCYFKIFMNKRHRLSSHCSSDLMSLRPFLEEGRRQTIQQAPWTRTRSPTLIGPRTVPWN